MKRIFFLILTVYASLTISCSPAQQSSENTLVLIKTEFGNMKIKLYEDTPEHKKNFIKLIEDGFYKDLLFHRVINEFMIQGGDPNSKNAAPGERLGSGGPGYTIPAEIKPQYFHKKGALAAARTGGSSNPEKRSSGSQFYIVQGSVLTQGSLDTMEMRLNSKLQQDLFRKTVTAANNELNEFRTNNDEAGFNIRIAELKAEADSLYDVSEKIKFSEEKRMAYSTLGGYPSLDNEYTVFGEMIEGLEVLDKIAALEVDQANRPIEDVKMEIELVK